MLDSDYCPGIHAGLLGSLFGLTESYGGVLLLMLILLVSENGIRTHCDCNIAKLIFIFELTVFHMFSKLNDVSHCRAVSAM